MNRLELPALGAAQVAALLPDAPARVSWLGMGSDHHAFALAGRGEVLRRKARLLAWLTPGCPARRCRRCCAWGPPRRWLRRVSVWRGACRVGRRWGPPCPIRSPWVVRWGAGWRICTT
ncbi:hypothetical protein ACFQDE_04720 [Deinococcus caeni]|uniref:hypothetical protein n=1 Tax=Deinococcus caeni TaxID=569127 RepID=UPI0036197367